MCDLMWSLEFLHRNRPMLRQDLWHYRLITSMRLYHCVSTDFFTTITVPRFLPIPDSLPGLPTKRQTTDLTIRPRALVDESAMWAYPLSTRIPTSTSTATISPSGSGRVDTHGVKCVLRDPA